MGNSTQISESVKENYNQLKRRLATLAYNDRKKMLVSELRKTILTYDAPVLAKREISGLSAQNVTKAFNKITRKSNISINRNLPKNTRRLAAAVGSSRRTRRARK